MPVGRETAVGDSGALGLSVWESVKSHVYYHIYPIGREGNCMSKSPWRGKFLGK